MRRLCILIALSASLLRADGPARHRAADHQARVAQVQRVFLVILENTDASVAENLPFVARLAARGAILRNMHCIGHPSQPNYIALASGSTQGVTGSEPLTIDTTHLGDLMERRGLTWKLYAESYPGNCFLGETYGPIPSGQYVRRHVPVLSFLNVQQDFSRCAAHVVDARKFDEDLIAGKLPALSIYVPNNMNNGHDSGPFFADQWLESKFGSLIDDRRFIDETLFIVTYDESASSDLRVTTVFFGSMVRAGASSFASYDHYDLLRTIENLFALGTLGRFDATARPITGIWK